MVETKHAFNKFPVPSKSKMAAISVKMYNPTNKMMPHNAAMRCFLEYIGTLLSLVIYHISVYNERKKEIIKRLK